MSDLSRTIAVIVTNHLKARLKYYHVETVDATFNEKRVWGIMVRLRGNPMLAITIMPDGVNIGSWSGNYQRGITTYGFENPNMLDLVTDSAKEILSRFSAQPVVRRPGLRGLGAGRAK